MKTILGIIIVVCLVFVGCEDMARAPEQVQIDNNRTRILALEASIEIMERTWKLANTHEIKQDEKIAELEGLFDEEFTFWLGRMREYNKENWDVLIAILDYLELEREYYQAEFKLVKKEKGMK